MSRTLRVNGRRRVRGTHSVPGDKSISHRVAMLASIARGPSLISGFADSADCQATLGCLRELGVAIEERGKKLVIHGNGLRGYRPSSDPVLLNAGNSGSTIRMLSGIVAAQPLVTVIDGDESLRRRPMRRIIEPLTKMGASIDARGGDFAPLRISGGALNPITFASPTSSAQVKTCVLFAALHADGATTFTEPAPSRNHTELMLEEFGARIEGRGTELTIHGGFELNPVEYAVPGDLSSAAFFLAAAVLLPDSELVLTRVNLNPTRTAFLDVLKSLGANIEILNRDRLHGEQIGDLRATSGGLASTDEGLKLSGGIIANLIDEIPILAVAATQVEGRIEVRDATELRIKESDRIRTVVDGLRSMGAGVEEFDDGFAVNGPQRLRGARIETAGDHRIAMAFTIAGLTADGETEIVDYHCAEVSFPGFYDLVRSAAGDDALG